MRKACRLFAAMVAVFYAVDAAEWLADIAGAEWSANLMAAAFVVVVDSATGAAFAAIAGGVAYLASRADA